MAVSSRSLRERKSESFHFWLAIAAISLLFHALLIVGVKRWVKVAVVQPDAGAIEVEFVSAADAQETAVGEPIVPAAISKSEPKSEPYRPEPTPLPEFSPEPSSVVVEKPRPIVEPEKPRQPKKPKKPEEPEKPKPPAKPKKPNELSGVEVPGKELGAIRSFQLSSKEPQLKSSPGDLGHPGATASVRLVVPKSVEFPATFELKSGDIISFDFTFDIEDGALTSRSFEAIKINGSPWDEILKDLGERSKFLDFLESSLVVKFAVDNVVINNGRPEKPLTSWTAPIELRLGSMSSF